MKFLTAFFLTAFLGFAIGRLTNLPWWTFAVSSYLVALGVHQKTGKAFLASFLGIFLLWSLIAWMKDSANEHLLTIKVANILPLHGSYWLLIVITGLIGGLISGLAAISGSSSRKIFTSKK